MKQLIQRSQFFLFTSGLIFLLALILILNQEKGDAVIALNSSHTPFLDGFFKWMTKLGEWPLVVLGVGICLRNRKVWAVVIVASYAINGIIIQACKHLLFSGYDRPSKFLDVPFHEVIEVHRHNSFPSGHTNTAFAVLIILALAFSHRQWLGFALAVLAAFVGISRIYLFQHFLVDVTVGGVLGVIMALVISHWLINKSSLKNWSWLNYEDRNH